MQNSTLNIYKNIREGLENESSDGNSVTGTFKSAESNIAILVSAFGLGLISNILENNRSVRDNDLTSGKTYKLTLNPKISIGDDKEFYLSETDTDFAQYFSRNFEIPKNIYIHSIHKESPTAAELFKKNLVYAREVFKLLDLIYSYKNTEIDCMEFFLFSTKPLTIKTHYSTTNTDFTNEVKEVMDLIRSDLKRELYKPLLRLEIINFLHLTPEKERFKILMENFNTIHINFTNTLTLHATEFSFDNFKDVFQKEKEKYFGGLREILNKSFSQIITVPISIGAAVFASSKLTKDDRLTGDLVYSSFIIYVFYYLVIQVVYLLDLINLCKDFNQEFAVIKQKSGLTEESLQKKRNQVKNKFLSTIILSIALLLIVGTLGVLVCIHLYKKIKPG